MARKILFLIVLVGVTFFGCQKNVEPFAGEEANEEKAVKAAKKFLKTQLSSSELATLNWGKINFYKKGEEVKILAVPTNSLDNKAAFVFFKKDKIYGNWVTFFKDANNPQRYNLIHAETFDKVKLGLIHIDPDGLARNVEVFENGQRVQNRTNVLFVVPVEAMGPNFQLLYLANSLGIGMPLWGSGTLVFQDECEYVEPMDPGGGGGSSSPIYADIVFDYSSSGSGIDLQKFMNCFDQVPDNSSTTYSVKICADLPMDGDPHYVANGTTPGHAFLVMTKTNGSQSVTQAFGFYPVSGFLSIFSVGVNSKVVNDGGHEYEASMTINIDQINFNAVKNLALSHASNLLYDLNNFNCADFAVDCFNMARSLNDNLIVPDTHRVINYGTTPNGIYELLNQMKNSNHPEAANIQIGMFTAPSSHGECP